MIYHTKLGNGMSALRVKWLRMYPADEIARRKKYIIDSEALKKWGVFYFAVARSNEKLFKTLLPNDRERFLPDGSLS